MGTHHTGCADEVLALDTYIKLMRCVAVLGGRLQRALNEEGLTLSQLGVLETLMHLGPMCQKEVGAKLLLSGGNITTVVNNLEKRGLVIRIRDRSDRRFVQVRLTPEGDALIHRVFPQHAAAIAQQFAGLTCDEQRQLGALCRSLGRSIAADGG
jgi:MarR family 2-MHQ and catechol resistance regulon transcriptional repressor